MNPEQIEVQVERPGGIVEHYDLGDVVFEYNGKKTYKGICTDVSVGTEDCEMGMERLTTAASAAGIEMVPA